MSLLPLLSRSWWEPAFENPLRWHLDQHLGMKLDQGANLLAPSIYHGRLLHPKTLPQKSNKLEVVNDKNLFRVMLNVGHFRPEEISVKTVGNSIVVRCKHEEKTDEHGFIAREFTRRYVLPEGAEPETVTSSLTPDGILVVEAIKKTIEPPLVNERVVPIEVQQKSDNAQQ